MIELRKSSWAFILRGMLGFQIFDGNNDEFDTRSELIRYARKYPVGFKVKFIQWAGQLSAPLPVLVSTV